MIIEVIFWLSVACIVHSYLFYPALIKWLAGRKHPEYIQYQPGDDLPEVTVLMSVFNEEKVLERKVDTVMNSNYPSDKIEFIIGSDASDDRTDEILKSLTERYSNLKPYFFTERQGKNNVLNKISAQATGNIYILTDAKVIFEPDTMMNLIRYLKDPSIGLVGGNIITTQTFPSGISYQEKKFMNREILMKYREGLIWKAMIGAFGACYAIKSGLFPLIPVHSSVEDFFVTMKVLQRGKGCITDLGARCFEEVPNESAIEFRRKVRISSGNFQNLALFAGMLWPPYNGIAFAFLSHKVLRWLGPFFILLAFLSNALLTGTNSLYTVLFMLQGILLFIPFIDFLLRKIHLHNVILRFISHFYNMNLALFIGFFKFIKGTQTNVWQPTERNQQEAQHH
jgi:cellulose synthase/poly-beta-1,6-N-acetylglucosamine synthase-like glycosyltransferase